jgi:D-glycero-D-manno-heptose 1,7-bisphosphate phosphatase|tara:strand:- start:518 stop:1021 length:504 start_codon:yes stop_codon:yes gene_type:complete
MNRAVFLDRDGVINKKVSIKDFVKNIDELVYLPNVKRIIAKIKQKKYITIIVSNQSGINRGIIKKENMEKINEKLRKDLGIDGIYYCPHLPDENCACRKPKTGLIEKAVKDLNIDVKSSWLVGDNDFDIEAGKAAGLKTIRVEGNIGLAQIENRLDQLSKENIVKEC